MPDFLTALSLALFSILYVVDLDRLLVVSRNDMLAIPIFALLVYTSLLGLYGISTLNFTGNANFLSKTFSFPFNKLVLPFTLLK